MKIQRKPLTLFSEIFYIQTIFMKKLIFLSLFTMFVALNLGATNPPQKVEPKKVEQTAQTPQAPEAGLPEAARIEAEAEQAAQDSTKFEPPPNGTPTVQWFFDQFDALYSILLLAIVFISGWLPFLKKLDDKRLRALIVGIVLTGGFVVWQLFQKDLTWQDFGSYVFTFITTQLGYIFVLSPVPILKTPEPEKKAAAKA